MAIINNSKWWTHLFTTKGRASRLEYNLICLIVVCPLFLFLWNMMTSHTHYGENTLIWLLVYVVVALYLLICASVRRNHDLGNSGMTRSSIFGSEYCFKKGDEGVNRFGSDPCQDYESQISELD